MTQRISTKRSCRIISSNIVVCTAYFSSLKQLGYSAPFLLKFAINRDYIHGLTLLAFKDITFFWIFLVFSGGN